MLSDCYVTLKFPRKWKKHLNQNYQGLLHNEVGVALVGESADCAQQNEPWKVNVTNKSASWIQKTQIAKGNYGGWVDTLELQCKPKQALQLISFPWYDNLREEFVVEFTG